MTGVGLQSRVRFDAPALFGAVQAQRLERGMSWEAVATEVGVKAATIRRLAYADTTVDHDAEAAVRLATWIGCAVEAFAPGFPAGAPAAAPPEAAGRVEIVPGRVLDAVHETRHRRELSDRQAAAELGIGWQSLERLSTSGRVRLGLLLRVCRWCDLPTKHFATASDTEPCANRPGTPA